MVARADGPRRALVIDEALLAIAILKIADRIGGAAVGIRSAFATLAPNGIANRFVRRALAIHEAFHARSGGHVAGRCITRTIGIRGTRHITSIVLRLANLPRIAVGTRTALFTAAQDAKWRGDATIRVLETFHAT